MLPFINYFSNEVGASWCREPDSADIIDSKHQHTRIGQSQGEIVQFWKGFTSSERILKNDDCGINSYTN